MVGREEASGFLDIPLLKFTCELASLGMKISDSLLGLVGFKYSTNYL